MFKISQEDAYFYNEGKLFDAYRIFGSHLIKDDKGLVRGTRFTVFAPNARMVSVVGEFNNWLDEAHMMTKNR